MNDYDELDELEREVGPSLRLALDRAAAEITDEQRPHAQWPSRNGPAAPAIDLHEGQRRVEGQQPDDTDVLVVKLEPTQDGRGRHRRRWRVVAAAAAAVLLIAGVVLVRTTTDDDSQTEVPAGPGPTPTTDPPPSLPPPTFLPGTVIDEWAQFHVGWIFVYADGRVIWYSDIGAVVPEGANHYSILERRLSPSGLDLVRSGEIDFRDVLRDRDVNEREDAWADPEPRTYAPAGYAGCFLVEASPLDQLRDATSVLGELPPSTRARLRFPHRSYTGFDAWSVDEPVECLAVTPEEARALSPVTEMHDEGGFVPLPGRVSLSFLPVLPHGGVKAWGG